jgi:hypothetical protein
VLLSATIPLVATNTPEGDAYLGRACYALFLLSLSEGREHGIKAGPSDFVESLTNQPLQRLLDAVLRLIVHIVSHTLLGNS